jgi:ribosomal protein L29
MRKSELKQSTAEELQQRLRQIDSELDEFIKNPNKSIEKLAEPRKLKKERARILTFLHQGNQ